MKRGVCEYLKGSRAAAIEDFRAAVALDPALLSTYLSLGSLYHQEGRYQESLEILDRALAVKDSPEHRELRPILVKTRRQVAGLLRGVRRRSSPSTGSL